MKLLRRALGRGRRRRLLGLATVFVLLALDVPRVADGR